MFLNTSLASFLRQRCVTFQNSPGYQLSLPVNVACPSLVDLRTDPSRVSLGISQLSSFDLELCISTWWGSWQLVSLLRELCGIILAFLQQCVHPGNCFHCITSSLSIILIAIAIVTNQRYHHHYIIITVRIRCHFLSQVLYFVGFF